MDSFVLLCLWSLLVGTIAFNFGSSSEDAYIAEQCTQVGAFTVKDTTYICEPKYIQRGDKTYPLRESIQ